MKHFILYAFLCAQVTFMSINGDGLLYDMGGNHVDIVFMEPLSPRAGYDAINFNAPSESSLYHQQAVDHIREEALRHEMEYLNRLGRKR